MDLDGECLTDEDRELLEHPSVGGVILFGRNCTDPEQVGQLIKEIRAVPRRSPLLVTIDQEGGRVQRLREGVTRLPPSAEIGALYASEPDRALRLAERTGWVMACELRALDVDASFAPVVDLDHGLSQVIGDRAFHADPAVVIRLAQAQINGMRAGGMPATIKHYPGHGGVSIDSHEDLPIDGRSLEALRDWDLLPFERLIRKNVPGVMVAHIVFSEIDERPASLSQRWIAQLLIEGMGFDGAVVADDLSMAGAEVIADVGDRVRAAIEAGCDLTPVCNDRQAAIRAIEAVEGHTDHRRQRRARLCGHQPDPSLCHSLGDWRKARCEVAELSRD